MCRLGRTGCRRRDSSWDPDYWLSVVWKRTMGERVLDAVSSDTYVRTYAHCLPGGGAGLTVMLLNLDASRGRLVTLPGLPNRFDAYEFAADYLLGREVRLNGRLLAIESDDELPPLEPVRLHRGDPPWFELAPAGIAFLLFPDAEAPACR